MAVGAANVRSKTYSGPPHDPSARLRDKILSLSGLQHCPEHKDARGRRSLSLPSMVCFLPDLMFGI